MKWFFAVSEVSMDHHDHDFRALIRSAVNSARANTQLKPHMIFDGEEGTFTKEIRDLGVKIIRHRISFCDQIQHAQKAHRPDWASYMFVASGALLRLEIPLLEQHDDFVLYTDCDVLFLKQPDFTTVRPPLFAVAPERDCSSYDDMNSGVMIMNLPRLRADLPLLINFFCDTFAKVNGFDQEAYRKFYRGEWSRLPLAYNWKPYWGINLDASIVHFHGPKPPAIRKLISDPDYATPDVWRSLFLQNPESYRYYLSLWDSFQPTSHN
jgi:lipopolysaccharide biosynthesis glycosyltransferase